MDKEEKTFCGVPVGEIAGRALLYFILFIVMLAVMFALYAVVYERCYNIMNIDDMIVFRLYRSNDDGCLYAVYFNKLYKLFILY